MVILNFSKEQFIEWTTIGYPIQFNENINQKKFFEGMNDYINFNDNEFYSEFNAVIDTSMLDVYKGSEIIASIKYDGSRVVILTIINNDETITKESSKFISQQKDLGEVCLGVITFCQCMNLYVYDKIASNDLGTDIKPWPLSS